MAKMSDFMIKAVFRLALMGCLLLLGACSTTKNLPEDETLYTGVDDIEYLKRGQTVQITKDDSTGVITAIATAAEQIDALVSGFTGGSQDTAHRVRRALTEEEKVLMEARREASARDLAKAATEVNAVLEYAPNNALFGSAYHRVPLPIGLWAYNKYVNKNSGFSKWMYKSFASEPVLLSIVNPETRIKVATNTLHNYGFFRGSILYNIEKDKKNPKKAKVKYFVKPGRVFRLDSITYRNFPLSADSLIRKSMNETFLKKGDAFSVVNLTSEQSRLESLFRNAGYYY